jgi:flagellar hook-associated protein 3 FlgL
MVLQIDKTLTKLTDVDLASAIADMNLQLTSLQAAQQSYTKIQGLSLFNYI